MSESTIVQAVVQFGAVGICALLIVITGRRIDRLADAVSQLVQRVELMLDRKWRDEK